MSKLLTTFDGSGRAPRPHQVQILNWLVDTYPERFVAIGAGTGVGKGAISVAAILDGGVCITPSNALMDQLAVLYPSINTLKGKEHYAIPTEYTRAVDRFLTGEPTIANPYSYWYSKKRRGFKPPKVLVVDEAHNMTSTLRDLCSIRLPKSSYGEPRTTNTIDVLNWLGAVINKLSEEFRRLSNTVKLSETEFKRRMFITSQIDKVDGVIRDLNNDQQMLVVTKGTRYTEIQPLTPPTGVVDNFFNASKVILLSATLDRFSVRELLQARKFQFKDFGTPIPTSHRVIKYRPAPFGMNKDTTGRELAAWITGQLRKYPGLNTVVHMTYADVEKTRRYFPDALYSTPQTNAQTIQKFKQNGGLFLAAACAEGVDFPYDECRLTLIPKLVKPNISDPFVIKRIALADGETWCSMQVINTLIQQSGRGTRAADDSSISIVGDPMLMVYINKVRDEISEDFLNRIIK